MQDKSIAMLPAVNQLVVATMVCRACGETKSVDAFCTRKNRAGETLVRHTCKACEDAVRLAWRQRNRERIAAQAREWRKNNPEKARQIERQWRGRNPEKVKEKRARRERKLMATRPIETRQRATERQNRRRGRKQAAFVERVDRMAIYDRDMGICQLCGMPVPRDDFSIDHIIPLARGGTHEPASVQLAHLVCNKRKWMKLPEVMAE